VPKLGVKSPFLHPLLFALWMVLIWYGIGLGEFLPEEVVFPAFISMSAAFLLTAIFALVFRNVAKGAVFATCAIIAFFCFIEYEALALMLPWPRMKNPEMVLLVLYFILWLPVFVSVAVGAVKLGKYRIDFNWKEITSSLNLVGLLTCFASLVTALAYEVPQNLQAFRLVDAQHKKDRSRTFAGKELPDIYYFVFDAYANPYTLEDLYGYDCTNFLDFLKSKGFYVALQSRANHDYTNISLCSSLNMEYMNFLSPILGRNSLAQTAQFRMIENSRVANYLKKHGYKIINIASGYPPTNYIVGAEKNYNVGNSLVSTLMGASVLGPLEPYTYWIWDYFARQRLFPFENIAEIAAIKGPKFVLCHTLISHPPFIFDENGKALVMPRKQIAQEFIKSPYLTQLKFAEKKMRQMIEYLVSGPAKNAIIIIQSDHGPYATDMKERKTYLNERMRILNAYHLPDGNTNRLYQSITPVNSFRLLLDKYFNAGFDLLEDKSFASFEQAHYMQFNDVTGEVGFPEKKQLFRRFSSESAKRGNN